MRSFIGDILSSLCSYFHELLSLLIVLSRPTLFNSIHAHACTSGYDFHIYWWQHLIKMNWYSSRNRKKQIAIWLLPCGPTSVRAAPMKLLKRCHLNVFAGCVVMAHFLQIESRISETFSFHTRVPMLRPWNCQMRNDCRLHAFIRAQVCIRHMSIVRVQRAYF